jgi:hypothetical protein
LEFSRGISKRIAHNAIAFRLDEALDALMRSASSSSQQTGEARVGRKTGLNWVKGVAED